MVKFKNLETSKKILSYSILSLLIRFVVNSIILTFETLIYVYRIFESEMNQR